MKWFSNYYQIQVMAVCIVSKLKLIFLNNCSSINVKEIYSNVWIVIAEIKSYGVEKYA